MARVLLTGYGGFLGSEIARQLLAAGYQVRGVARKEYPELASMGVEAVRGSITDPSLIEKIVPGCDAIINTAANAGIWGAWNQYFPINTQATEHLLESAERANLRAFVQTSSPSVTFAGSDQSGVNESAPYPEKWLCFYPQTKALAEQAVLENARSGSVPGCALRPHLIWGLGDPHLFPRVIEKTLAGRLRRVGSGENLIDVVHVKHAARAHLNALERLLDGDGAVNGEAFFLTDGRPIPCWQWICKILELAEVPPPQRSISFSAAYRIGALLEGVYWIGRMRSEPPMTRFVAAQLAQDHYFDISKARERLGYAPNLDLDQEMEACRPWLKETAESMR